MLKQLKIYLTKKQLIMETIIQNKELPKFFWKYEITEKDIANNILHYLPNVDFLYYLPSIVETIYQKALKNIHNAKKEWFWEQIDRDYYECNLPFYSFTFKSDENWTYSVDIKTNWIVSLWMYVWYEEQMYNNIFSYIAKNLMCAIQAWFAQKYVTALNLFN